MNRITEYVDRKRGPTPKPSPTQLTHLRASAFSYFTWSFTTHIVFNLREWNISSKYEVYTAIFFGYLVVVHFAVRPIMLFTYIIHQQPEANETLNYNHWYTEAVIPDHQISIFSERVLCVRRKYGPEPRALRWLGLFRREIGRKISVWASACAGLLPVLFHRRSAKAAAPWSHNNWCL